MDQYDDLDPEGSCMAQIQALVQSEYSDLSQASKNEKEFRKPGHAINHDSCDSCGEGGDLLCCDRCPCAFHFTCCDPPLDEDDIPSGEWLCNECRSCRPEHEDDDGEAEEDELPEIECEYFEEDKEQNDKISPFSTLVKMSSGKNPSTFSLPPELACHTYFPGDRKRKIANVNEEKAPASKTDNRESDFDEGCHLDKLCYACSRSSLHGEMVECDFCPLSFHTNCLTPPLTNKPSGMWMCPNHAEHAEPGLKDPRFSRRLKAYNELRNNVSQHTIKLDFLNRVHSLRNHPDFERKQTSWKRKRLTIVPEAVKCHYKNPPIQQLPQHIKDSLKPLPPYRLPITPPTSKEQEEWLKSIVSLQCSIAKHLSSLSSPKHQDVNKKSNKTVLTGPLNHAISTTKTSTTTKTVSSITTANSKTLKPVQNSTPTLSPSQQTIVKTVSLTKPNLVGGNVTTKIVPSVSSNSSLSTNVTAFNRVVTTHTITSGGKTLTKPITILYASKNQQNGVGSSMTKQLTVNNCINKVASIDNKSTLKLDSNSKNQTLHSSLTNSTKGSVLNDLKAFTNGPMQAFKTRTIGEVTKAASVSSPGVNSPRTMNVVGTVSTSLSSGTGPTKVIVLTNSANSSIIKNIASTTLSSSIQRPVVNSVTQGNSVTHGTTSTSATSPTVQRIVVSGSPQKGVGSSSGGATTQATSPNAVSAICAVSGLDTLQESELSKLDSRLVHVLAYQRLQQLVAQTTNKVNSTNSSVSRKISFNGTKETVVLPQKVPRGKALAVLCPINGEGSSCPMIYKTLNIGQAPDMDVCLRNYGYCNFLSDKHCCVFYDEATKQYELLNYSEHGTYVDNVLYSCDFSDKPRRTTITSSRKLDPGRLSKDKLLGAKKPPDVDSVPRRTSGLGIQFVTKPCNCSASSSTLIGGSGAGWEGTATLHHGSYIKVGCLQFIFSIVNRASKLEPSKKTGVEKMGSSASEL